MSASPHPDWLAVGSKVEVVRGSLRSITHRHTAQVLRHTKTLVVLDTGERFKGVRIGHNNVAYEMIPRYINYRTWLQPVSDIEGGDAAPLPRRPLVDDNAKHRIWLSEGQWTIQHPMDCDIDLCAVRALADRDNTMKRLYRIEEQRAAGQPARRSTRRIHLGKS